MLALMRGSGWYALAALVVWLAHGPVVAADSPVCRCLDTASRVAIGSVERSLALLPDRDRADRVRLRELRDIVSRWRGAGTLVLVTHGFTIEPLVGTIPQQAETLVLKPVPGSETTMDVVGRIDPPRLDDR